MKKFEIVIRLSLEARDELEARAKIVRALFFDFDDFVIEEIYELGGEKNA